MDGPRQGPAIFYRIESLFYVINSHNLLFIVSLTINLWGLQTKYRARHLMLNTSYVVVEPVCSPWRFWNKYCISNKQFLFNILFWNGPGAVHYRFIMHWWICPEKLRNWAKNRFDKIKRCMISWHALSGALENCSHMHLFSHFVDVWIYLFLCRSNWRNRFPGPHQPTQIWRMNCSNVRFCCFVCCMLLFCMVYYNVKSN